MTRAGVSSPPQRSDRATPGQAVHVLAEVVRVRRFGAYWRITLRAPSVAACCQAGQFIAVSVAEDVSRLLRRCFSVLDASDRDGLVDFAVAVYSRGTAWLAARRPGERIDIVAPLGRPFPLPAQPAPCLLIGGGHGAAALYRLAKDCRERGCAPRVVLGAASRDRLFGPELFEGLAESVTVVTDDGSFGGEGSVCDVMPRLLDAQRPATVYACGPMPMLRRVTELAGRAGVTTYVAAEAAMACGIGVCMTCVLPVIHDDGITRMTRSCVEGPVFRGDRVRWADLGTVPDDCWGA